MNRLELLYSHEEWEKKKKDCNMMGISENTGRLLELSFNFNRTEQEELEYQKLLGQINNDTINNKYTKLTYEITDLYNDLKYIHDNKKRRRVYNIIGRKQCEIEILKEREYH
jgi:hypothetical protein